MGNLCGSNEEDELEKEYICAPRPNQYNGKRNWQKQRHGYGTYFYDNGDVYEGNWENDEKHGLGTYNFASGKVLKGFFDKDSYIGAAPVKTKKKKTNKIEQAPAKKIYMDDDGLIVTESRIQPSRGGNNKFQDDRFSEQQAARKRQEEIKRNREERHKKTVQKMRQKYNIPDPK